MIGSFLPFLLPLLNALGAAGGSVATIVKAVNDAKAQSQQLEEKKRHSTAMKTVEIISNSEIN